MPEAGEIILFACPKSDEVDRAKRILSQAGYAIVEAPDGPAVVKELKRALHPPSMVVLHSIEHDTDMPTFSCLGWIHSQDNLAQTKTLMVSDEVDLIQLRECIDVGLNGFLQAPYTDAQLLMEAKKWAPPRSKAPPPPAPPATTAPPLSDMPALDIPAPSLEDPVGAEPSYKSASAPFFEDLDDDTPAPSYPSPTPSAGNGYDDANDDMDDTPVPSGGDDSIAIGEFDEEDAGDEIDFGSFSGDEESLLTLTPEMQALIEKRLHIQIEAEKLEKSRKHLVKSDDIADSTKAVYNALSAELRRIPNGKEAHERLQALEQKIRSFQESAEAGERPPATADLLAAWEMARKQRKLWIEREKIIPDIRKAAIHYLREEPLFKLLLKFKFPAEILFGYAVYVLALEAEQARLQRARKSLQKNLNKMEENSKGLFSAFRKDEGAEKKVSLSATTTEIATRLNAISREISDLEPAMVKEFWRCYELSACIYVSGKIPEEKKPLLRALLRFGLLGHAPWFIKPDVGEYLMKSATEDVIQAWDPSTSANRVFYPDEYIAFSVSGDMTESIDENLELTMRNSPQWTADKARRRIAFSNLREHALYESMEVLRKRINDLRVKQDSMETEKENLIRSAKDYKQRKTELAQSIQHCKVEAARLGRAIDKIETKYLPDLKERQQMAKEKLRSSGFVASAFDIARHEVAGIHRVSRLCAKLKDPFLPFVLRDNYKLGVDVVNDRPAMLKELAQIEKMDQTIFKDVLIPSRKPQQRVYIRYHPVFLLTPSCGFLAYSWNPRVGVEIGRLVFPGYCPRSGLRDRMLYNMLSDFRWDTSKSAAGVDLLTSDTLVAAYATVRWEYRKKNKVNREKALIFNELNDRQNWRRHYELYLQSAEDSGRKLFFKNTEVYEVILKYIGLPEGKERLRR